MERKGDGYVIMCLCIIIIYLPKFPSISYFLSLIISVSAQFFFVNIHHISVTAIGPWKALKHRSKQGDRQYLQLTDPEGGCIICGWMTFLLLPCSSFVFLLFLSCSLVLFIHLYTSVSFILFLSFPLSVDLSISLFSSLCVSLLSIPFSVTS